MLNFSQISECITSGFTKKALPNEARPLNDNLPEAVSAKCQYDIRISLMSRREDTSEGCTKVMDCLYQNSDLRKHFHLEFLLCSEVRLDYLSKEEPTSEEKQRKFNLVLKIIPPQIVKKHSLDPRYVILFRFRNDKTE